MEAVSESSGKLIYNTSIPDIAYDAALIDLPASHVNYLLEREDTALVICDEVMLIRPQSIASFPIESNAIEADNIQTTESLILKNAPPIVGLFDGVPLQAHRLLDGRLLLDDPDNLNEISSPTKRYHGTGMASLIIRGDLNRGELSIQHPIYIRPVLYASGNDKDERTQRDRLLVDTIYRAVMRMRFGDGDEEAVAPNVFIVNLSIGDRTRPFANHISPLGRLLDYLAFRYDILFIVSAGNVHEPLLVSALQGNEDLDSPAFLQRAVLQALGDQRSQRTLLSPAEAINVITVGSWYVDSVETDLPSYNYEPYIEEGPNISSGQGLGYKKVIKPDIFMPGGRERFQVVRKDEQGISIQHVPSGRIHGLGVAIPDPNGLLDKRGLMSGTSVATALATRSAHMLFDFLIGNDEGVLAGMDPEFYAVVIKALLVHRARWSEEISCLLESISESNDTSHYIERRDNIARLLGYGYPVIEESMNCAFNRATLVGYGEILPAKDSHQFRIPLPPSLDRVTEPRSITLTLAWFSPVNVRSQTYRRAKLEIKPDNFKEKAGVSRFRLQPSDKSVPRGTIFHTHYKGCRAVEFVDDGNLNFKVFCREQGGLLDQPIRYGLAFTIEAGEKIPVYQEIREHLAIRPRVSGYTV